MLTASEHAPLGSVCGALPVTEALDHQHLGKGIPQHHHIALRAAHKLVYLQHVRCIQDGVKAASRIESMRVEA